MDKPLVPSGNWRSKIIETRKNNSMSKELSPETLSRIEREAEELYPKKFLLDRYQNEAYISCAKEYEAKLMEKEIEIAELKSALQAEEFAHQLSKNRINNLMNPF